MPTAAAPSVTTRELTDRECWDYLAAREYGRIAVIRDGEPAIYPIGYAVAPGGIRIRTRIGSKLLAILIDGRVAFEVDDLDEHVARSVMVVGWAEQLDAHDAAESSTPVAPYAGADAHAVLLITPTRITGRELSLDAATVRSP
ncbi:MAG: pyridoxamine 5'-phosphate oxidase family protein [Acidobacteria bacterium]|nr:pyridoxamine 5'-phosphate oxidase family protein [Acidobacteriota bacterium]